MLFEREVLTSQFLLKEMWPLLERHYKEISAFQDIPLKPDFEKYLLMEQSGSIRCFVARDDQDGMRLIGYAVFFVHLNMHYSTSLQANQDVLYLEKSSRGGKWKYLRFARIWLRRLGLWFGRPTLGEMFINWCDSQLASEQVEVVYHHVKTKFNFGPMLEKLGYKHIENIYARDLRRNT